MLKKNKKLEEDFYLFKWIKKDWIPFLMIKSIILGITKDLMKWMNLNKDLV